MQKLTMLMIATLMIFSTVSCQTTVENTVTPVVIPVPVPPERPDVHFVDVNNMIDKPKDGLWLSYDDGRKLAKYINDVEAHREKLETILEYYREEKAPPD